MWVLLLRYKWCTWSQSGRRRQQSSRLQLSGSWASSCRSPGLAAASSKLFVLTTTDPLSTIWISYKIILGNYRYLLLPKMRSYCCVRDGYLAMVGLLTLFLLLARYFGFPPKRNVSPKCNGETKWRNRELFRLNFAAKKWQKYLFWGNFAKLAERNETA